MTKALRNMTKQEQEKAIARRLQSKTGGLGYWAAVDARKKQAQPVKQEITPKNK